MKYDVVIIGSGLGGLLCGYILSKEGYNVCIAEKDSKFGGCLQSFVREGIVFDTGVHYIGSLDEGQNLYKYFKYFDLIGKLNLKRMDNNAYDIISFTSDKEIYGLAMGQENFAELLSARFPLEREGIYKYAHKIKEINESFGLISLGENEHSKYDPIAYLSKSAYDFISSFTSDYRLQQVLAGNNAMYAGDMNKTSLFTYSLITYYYMNSAYRLVGGSDQIAKELITSIVLNGGTVLKNYELINLIEKDGKIIISEFANGEKIEATTFISGISPSDTLQKIKGGFIKKSFRNRIMNLENTISVFSLYGILKKESFPYINSNYFVHNTDNAWDTANYNDNTWPKGYMFLTQPSALSEKYAKAFSVMTYMKYEDVKTWENSEVESRGKNYQKFKEEKAEILLESTEKMFPGIKSLISNYFTATPLTYRDYTGTPQGSLYGIMRDYNKPYESIIYPRTKISNLLLTGQNVNMHGVLGVTIGAIMTCSELLGMDYLIRKVNNAQ
jgi:all-trans-retinol 13,14-reductase